MPGIAHERDTVRAAARGRWRQALAASERWLAVEPDDVEAQLERAQTLDRLGRPREGREMLQAVAAQVPGHQVADDVAARMELRGRTGMDVFASGLSADGAVRHRAVTADGAGEGAWAGRWILTAGLGGMGGAQPLAATFAGAVSLNIECQQASIDFRLRTRYLDKQARDLDDALRLIEEHTAKGDAVSIGLLGNAAEILPELARRAKAGGPKPDLVTDQTSAHDLINGYLPAGWTVAQWRAAQADPAQHARLQQEAAQSCAVHVRAMLDFHAMGVPTVDYGNNIRQVALDQGVKNAFDFPGFVPAYIRPLFCEGKGPFRWVALSGDPQDIHKTDAKIKQLFPHNAHVHRWLDMAGQRIAFQGLPARICWLGLGERHVAGLAFNEMVKSGELKAPIVIGRDHLDTGSVASPNRETEAMKDGTDAVSDWPLLNALLNASGGATWVSLHHGGGVGMGYSQHSGMVIVADGTDAAAKRLARVLVNDCGSGVMRHADAGYELAIRTAREQGLNLPMLRG